MTSLLDQRTFCRRDVAAFLNVKTDTVLDFIHAGELPASDCSRPGSKKPRWRVLEEDLGLFLAKRRKVPPPKPYRRKRKTEGVIEFYK